MVFLTFEIHKCFVLTVKKLAISGNEILYYAFNHILLFQATYNLFYNAHIFLGVPAI